MTGWKIHHLKMYFLLKIRFSNVMLVFRHVTFTVISSSKTLHVFLHRSQFSYGPICLWPPPTPNRNPQHLSAERPTFSEKMIEIFEPSTSSWFEIWIGWWFRNPANQLRLVVYPIYLQRFSNYIPGGAGFQPSTVPHKHFPEKLLSWCPNTFRRVRRCIR